MTVVFIDTVHPVLSERLSAAGYQCIHLETAPKEEVYEALKTAKGMVIRSKFPVNVELLQNCHHLKFIARSGAGLENIDLDYCKKHHISVYNSPEGNKDAVGEHALGLLLSLCNKLHVGHESIKNGQWLREAHRGEEIGHKTIGIIGYGHNGSAFAEKLSGFGCQILAYDKYQPVEENTYVKAADLESIQSTCDVISFHVPENEETRAYFNEHFLSKLSKPVYLLNVSRGKVVSLQAVERGLKEGKLKGVGLDVYEFESKSFENTQKNEPFEVFQRLLLLPNVIFSPHVAGWTTESYKKLSDVLADKILQSQTKR